MSALFDELQKLGESDRNPSSVWAPKTVGAPRSKLSGVQSPKAPTAPGSMAPHNVEPVAKYGPQDYSQPNSATAPETNPSVEMTARIQRPPNVVFGVR